VVGARHRSAAVLNQLANGAADDGRKTALEACCEQPSAPRGGVVGAPNDGDWGARADEAFAALHAEDTELAPRSTGSSVERARELRGRGGHKPDLEAMCLELVLAASGCTRRSPIR
jgi:hypothetical protein